MSLISFSLIFLSQNWMSYLGLTPMATDTLGQDASQEGPVTVQNNTSDEAKKLAAAALAAVKDEAAASASGRGKIAVSSLLPGALIFVLHYLWVFTTLHALTWPN